MNAKQWQCEMSEIKLWLKTGVFHSHSSLNLTLILMSVICLAERNQIIIMKC